MFQVLSPPPPHPHHNLIPRDISDRLLVIISHLEPFEVKTVMNSLAGLQKEKLAGE